MRGLAYRPAGWCSVSCVVTVRGSDYATDRHTRGVAQLEGAASQTNRARAGKTLRAVMNGELLLELINERFKRTQLAGID